MFILQTVVEYMGCSVHGCPKDTDPDKTNCFGILHRDAYEKTLEKIRRLRQSDEVNDVLVMWRCDWLNAKKNNPEVEAWFEDPANKELVSQHPRRLHLRSCFRGGITDAASTFFDSQSWTQRLKETFASKDVEEEVIATATLVDYNSLYPSLVLTPTEGPFEHQTDYVLTPYGPFVTLLGHDECIQECTSFCNRRCARQDYHPVCGPDFCATVCDQHHGFSDWGRTPGFALVKVLPPKTCRFPILRTVVKQGNETRNVAPCCHQCALTKDCLSLDWNCLHTEDERSFVGEYTTLELKYAVTEQGYRLLKVYEVQYYTRFSCTVFAPLMQLFGKMKIVSKGFPLSNGNPMSDVEKRTFVDSLRRETGMDSIRIEDVKDSPARGTLAKLLICSVIGKFRVSFLSTVRPQLYIFLL